MHQINAPLRQWSLSQFSKRLTNPNYFENCVINRILGADYEIKACIHSNVFLLFILVLSCRFESVIFCSFMKSSCEAISSKQACLRLSHASYFSRYCQINYFTVLIMVYRVQSTAFLCAISMFYPVAALMIDFSTSFTSGSLLSLSDIGRFIGGRGWGVLSIFHCVVYWLAFWSRWTDWISAWWDCSDMRGIYDFLTRFLNILKKFYYVFIA